MVCGCLTAWMVLTALCVILLLRLLGRSLTLGWNITMTKDFLAALMVEWHPPVLGSSSINKLGLDNGTYGNLLRAMKNLELGLDMSQEPVIAVIVIISFTVSIIFHTNLYSPSFCFSYRKLTIQQDVL